jgi:hypothetical protein
MVGRMPKVIITAKIVVNYDFGVRVPKKWRIGELSSNITEGVCDHSQVINKASVYVDKISISESSRQPDAGEKDEHE